MLTCKPLNSSYCHAHFKAEEANGESKIGLSVAEQVDQQQQQLDEITEKLENAQRTQKQLFLIVFQVGMNRCKFLNIVSCDSVKCQRFSNIFRRIANVFGNLQKILFRPALRVVRFLCKFFHVYY